MRTLVVLPIIVLLGCSGAGPNEAQLVSDFATVQPNCQILRTSHLEGDSDNVYIEIEYNCSLGTGSKKILLLYQFQHGTWRLNKYRG